MPQTFIPHSRTHHRWFVARLNGVRWIWANSPAPFIYTSHLFYRVYEFAMCHSFAIEHPIQLVHTKHFTHLLYNSFKVSQNIWVWSYIIYHYHNICFSFDPDCGTATQRFIRRIHYPTRTFNIDLVTINILFIGLDRDDGFSFTRLCVPSNYMLIYVDSFLHATNATNSFNIILFTVLALLNFLKAVLNFALLTAPFSFFSTSPNSFSWSNFLSLIKK